MKPESKARQAGLGYTLQLQQRIPTGLDGPLTHLLHEQHQAEIALDQAKLRVSEFLTAAEYHIALAAGNSVMPRDALPPGVRRWVIEIAARSESVSYPHR